MSEDARTNAIDCTRGFLDLGDVSIEFAKYRGLQPARGEPVVLLHQGLGCVEMWGQFPGELAARSGREVFAYSRQGFGGSSPECESRGIDFMHRSALEELPRVLAAADIERFSLLGHSDGGSIALIYAARQPTGSEGLDAVISMAAHVFNEPRCVTGVAAAADAYRGAGLRQALARYHGEQVDTMFAGWRDFWRDPGARDWSIEDELEQICVPLLAIQGAQDDYCTVSQLDSMQARCGGPVVRALLERCGHIPYREAPEPTLARITAFLSQPLHGAQA